MSEFVPQLRLLWEIIDILRRNVQSFWALITYIEPNDGGGNGRMAARSQLAKYPSADDTINI